MSQFVFNGTQTRVTYLSIIVTMLTWWIMIEFAETCYDIH